MIKKKDGFTLVELVIVIAIIAILTAVLVPTFGSVINNANKSADLQTMTIINTRLMTDDITLSELKECDLNITDWELAYSKVQNEVLIVDDTDIVKAARVQRMVGEELPDGYIRVSILSDSDWLGEDNDNTQGIGNSNATPGQVETQENWWDSIGPTEDPLPEKGSAAYDALCQKEDLNFTDIKTIPGATKKAEGYFYNNQNLKRIYLGSDITYIPNYAFYDCLNLEEVYFAADKITIGYSAFNGCEKLSIINLDNIIEIEGNAFRGCSLLSNVTLKKVTKIGMDAFNGCKELKKLDLPQTLNEVDYLTFGGCYFEQLSLPCIPYITRSSDDAKATFTVKHLEIDGGEQRKVINVDFSTFIQAIIANDKGLGKDPLESVTVRNITLESGITPFINMTASMSIYIKDELSYNYIIASAKNASKPFGDATIHKGWE